MTLRYHIYSAKASLLEAMALKVKAASHRSHVFHQNTRSTINISYEIQ